MATALVVLANGFEEIEAITPIDLLRRAEIVVETATIEEKLETTGAHGITVKADTFLENVRDNEFDFIILPGGQPGSNNLKKSPELKQFLRVQSKMKKGIAAICAAPTILENAGVLKGQKITSYPGLESHFTSSHYQTENVVISENIITSRAVGTAIAFSLELVKKMKGKEVADKIAKAILF